MTRLKAENMPRLQTKQNVFVFGSKHILSLIIHRAHLVDGSDWPSPAIGRKVRRILQRRMFLLLVPNIF